MSVEPAPARQPRGEARRRAVLEAVLRVVAREGIRGTTHRAVAAEAGTSLRATTYYFSSREDLLAQALEHYVDDRIVRLEELATQLPSLGPLDADRAVDALTAFVLDELAGGHARLVAEYELALEATRQPRLLAGYERLGRTLERLIATLAELAGAADPARDARLILAFVRGVELDELARSDPSPEEELRELCRRMVAALLGARD